LRMNILTCAQPKTSGSWTTVVYSLGAWIDWSWCDVRLTHISDAVILFGICYETACRWPQHWRKIGQYRKGQRNIPIQAYLEYYVALKLHFFTPGPIHRISSRDGCYLAMGCLPLNITNSYFILRELKAWTFQSAVDYQFSFTIHYSLHFSE
jgi:hypothetical protein